jgi:hypothetical protein
VRLTPTYLELSNIQPSVTFARRFRGKGGSKAGYCVGSERGQEGQQVRLGFPGCGACWGQAGATPEALKRFPPHLQVGGDVAIGRRDACVAEVVADNGGIVAGLQKRDGTTVPAISIKIQSPFDSLASASRGRRYQHNPGVARTRVARYYQHLRRDRSGNQGACARCLHYQGGNPI